MMLAFGFDSRGCKGKVFFFYYSGGISRLWFLLTFVVSLWGARFTFVTAFERNIENWF